ncbi:hypothetical protein AIIKEEIJ_03640 [Rhodococcus sp. YH1]|nr:hypothetical protein [Rhodococcus sp. YH1]
MLDRVLGHQTRVVGAATRDDEHLVHVAQLLIRQPLLVEHDAAPGEVPEQRVGHRGGLLLDLLEHEVVVAALLGGRQIPVDLERAGHHVGAAVEIGHLIPVGGDHHHLVLAQLHRVPGVLDERGHVRGHERLAVADPDDQRRRPARRDDRVRMVGMGEHQCEGPLEPAQHRQRTGLEVPRGRPVRIRPGHQMHRHLGVGVAGELHPGLLELHPQRREVLDDAVVHHRHLPRPVPVRMRIAVGGTTVRGPPGVPHAGGAGEVLHPHLVELGLEIGQPARLALDGQAARTVQDRHTGRVVAPVLHPPQCLHHDIESRAMPDVPHDSAHG